MGIGIALSPFALDATENVVDAAVAAAEQAAEAGLASVWFGQGFSHDAIALAGIVGRAVPGIEVGTSAVPISARHPLLISGQAQTSQAATHGAFTLGLAVGVKAFTESAFGVPFDRPITRLREFLTALRTLLDDGSADFHGETVTAVTELPGAVAGAVPSVPVLVAAMGPQALRVSGELADGTLPLMVGPKALEQHIVVPITAAAERAGRPRPRIVAGVAGVVTARVDETREQAAVLTAFYDRVPSYRRVIELSGATRAADLVVIGDEQAVADMVEHYFDAGATDVVVSQTDLAGPADRLRTWQLLGELARSRPRGNRPV